MHKKSIADLAYDILEENHRPMHYRQITEEVIKVKDLKAENPHHDVNASMGVDQRFIRYQRGIWGLVKWKYREAHLPYTLTSYCLRNGTIFLTSYLKPHFSWSRDDSNIEIIFVDIDGEEINALVNYRKKLIFGLKEWYRKRKLDVNDTVLIGLIDNSKKKYFIIAEKDIRPDTKKDIGDTIYQVLKEEGQPLSYSRIYAEIIKQDPDKSSLFVEYIKSILISDSRYVEISKDHWGLIEWLNEIEQIYRNLLHADSVKDFHAFLKQCFEFLGYKVEYLDNYRHSLLIARADLDYKSYSLLITGLPNNYDINMIRSIDWPGIKKIKENIGVNSVILFSEEFGVKELIDRSSEEGIQLYQISMLYKIIREHQQMPFSLFELQIAFSPMHHPSNNSDKLMGIREKQWDQWILIREIMKILKKARKKNNYMDINLLFKEIGTSRNSNAINSMEERLVKSTINQLTQEPFKIIELSESGNIILAYPGSIVQKKINCLFRFFMSEKL
jgi:DNA-directed RNA polymerase delta subunit